MKGIFKTLEAVLGVILILIVITSVYPIQSRTDVQLSDTAYNCLKYLDDKTVLRYYAMNNLESDLNDDIEDCLPNTMNFTARICSTTTCTANVPEDLPVFLSSYLIAGNTYIDPTLVNLWVWSK